MAELIAKQVANYFLFFANGAQEPITNLKLQKLLYYAQGYFLAMHADLLFEDEIQAWAHGPVVPNIYHDYKRFRWMPINKEVIPPTLTAKLMEYLELIIETFMPIDAYKLERMTHNEAPWIKARGGLPRDAACQTVIDPDDMKEYFTALMAQDE